MKRKIMKKKPQREQSRPRYCSCCCKWHVTSAAGIAEHAAFCSTDPISAAFAVVAGRM